VERCLACEADGTGRRRVIGDGGFESEFHESTVTTNAPTEDEDDDEYEDEKKLLTANC